MQKIIIISGATASGKSKLAISLAKKCNGIIINADSMQIYKGLPTLSAQPSKEDGKTIKHHLYSRLEPKEKCSVGIWLEFVKEEIDKAKKAKRTPIVVGGTGMYISTLINGLSPIPHISQEARDSAEELYGKIGNEKFFKLISVVDKKIVLKVQKNDKQRLLRAYEVFQETGKTLSDWQKIPNIKPYKKDEFFHINVEVPREKLYEKINIRFDQMMEGDVVINEVKQFLEKYPEAIDKKYTAVTTLGFAEIKDFLDGKITHERMVELSKQKTRNYAKRQLTWFRNQFKDSDILKLESINIHTPTQICRHFKKNHNINSIK